METMKTRQQSILTFAVMTSLICASSFTANNHKQNLQRFHVPFPCLDAVQDVVTTLCDKREAEIQVVFSSSYFNTCVTVCGVAIQLK